MKGNEHQVLRAGAAAVVQLAGVDEADLAVGGDRGVVVAVDGQYEQGAIGMAQAQVGAAGQPSPACRGRDLAGRWSITNARRPTLGACIGRPATALGAKSRR